MNKPTVSIYLDKRRIAKDGGHRVRIRITFKKKSKYYDTGIILEENSFLRIMSSKKKTETEKEQKIKLEALKYKAEIIVEKLPVFSIQQFEKRFYNNKEASNTISCGFDAHISQLNETKRFGTADSYTSAKSSFEVFSPQATYADVDAQFLNKYENWMKENEKSITTVGIYTRSLRTIFNNAKSDELIDNSLYPFGKRKYIIPTSKNNKRALSLNEVKKIFDYPAEDKTHIDFSKDFWIFIYLCNGMNVIDLCRLKWSQIDNNILTYTRVKTEKTKREIEAIIVPLKKRSWEVINKWGNVCRNPDDYIFPFFNNLEKKSKAERSRKKEINKRINEGLKKIRQDLDIGIDLTTYVARHTYATIMIQNNMPLTTLKSQMGHSTITTTEKYIGSLGLKNLIEISDKLTDFG